MARAATGSVPFDTGRFFSLSVNLLAIADFDGRFRLLNPAWQRVLGYELSELVGAPFIEFVHPDDREKTVREAEHLARGGVTIEFENRYACKDGSFRRLAWNATAVQEDRLIYAIARDVTERRAAEEKIVAQAVLLDLAHDAIIACDDDARIVYWNRAAERTYGWRAEEALGQDVHKLLKSKLPESRAAIAIGLEQERIWEGEVRQVGRDGRELVVESRWAMEAGEPSRVLQINRDITLRKVAEEQASRSRHEAERANRAKSDFLSRMSHELRTPLNSILGFAQLLDMDGLAAEQERMVRQIIGAGRHLLELINEVLDISRIEEGRISLSLEPVQVSAYVRQVAEIVRPMADARSVRVGGDAFERSAYVRADGQRLRQVLLNLVTNAINYNREGGHVDISSVQEGDRVRIRISDTGRGIPPERMHELFIPFARLGGEELGQEGTGLGLALSQRLVEIMGGRMGATSNFGEGSEFWIELPASRAPEPSPVPAEPAAASAIPPTQGDVLYIEDNAANFALVQQILSRRPGIVLSGATEGEVGLKLARDRRPDLVLLDLHLPDVPGETALRRLRDDPRTRDVAIVILSADATPGQIRRLMAGGADAYLTKPLDVAQFLATVDRLLEGTDVR